jgi:hypothetical protein
VRRVHAAHQPGIHRPLQPGGQQLEGAEGGSFGRGRRLVVGHDSFEHHRVQGGVFAGEAPVGLAATAQIGDRIVGGADLTHATSEELEPVQEQLLDHAVLAAEPGVHVHRAHAGFGGDAPHRQRRGALCGEEAVGGSQQRAAHVVEMTGGGEAHVPQASRGRLCRMS